MICWRTSFRFPVATKKYLSTVFNFSPYISTAKNKLSPTYEYIPYTSFLLHRTHCTSTDFEILTIPLRSTRWGCLIPHKSTKQKCMKLSECLISGKRTLLRSSHINKYPKSTTYADVDRGWVLFLIIITTTITLTIKLLDQLMNVRS